MGDKISIFGNYLGINGDGVTPMPNKIGIASGVGTNPLIGGQIPEQRNLIATNSIAQLALGSQATVQGNYIGLLSNGQLPNVNSRGGVGVAVVPGTSRVLIGGVEANQRNYIAGSTNSGILVFGPDTYDNAFLGNTMQDNGINIDIAQDSNNDNVPDTDMGATTNDSGDIDSGTNDLLNHPVINSAVYDPLNSNIEVNFDLDVSGSSAGNYRVEFFSNTGGVDSLVGAKISQSGLNTMNIGVDPNSTLQPGTTIKATATQLNNDLPNIDYFGSTSEFSQLLEVSGVPMLPQGAQSRSSGGGIIDSVRNKTTGVVNTIKKAAVNISKAVSKSPVINSIAVVSLLIIAVRVIILRF